MVPEHGETIKKLGYIPVGLGKKSFPNYFLSDKYFDLINLWIMKEKSYFTKNFGG